MTPADTALMLAEQDAWMRPLTTAEAWVAPPGSAAGLRPAAVAITEALPAMLEREPTRTEVQKLMRAAVQGAISREQRAEGATAAAAAAASAVHSSGAKGPAAPAEPAPGSAGGASVSTLSDRPKLSAESAPFFPQESTVLPKGAYMLFDHLAPNRPNALRSLGHSGTAAVREGFFKT